MVTTQINLRIEQDEVDLLDSLAEFIDGREAMSIKLLTVTEVEAFLDSKRLAYRSTLRARLSTLFKYAVRRRYRPDNPCSQLEPVTVTKGPPSFLTVEQTLKLLKWFRKHPRSMAWFVLSTFAGLRPEEAQKTTWADIHFKEGWIKVEAQTTKVRQRRVVYPKRMALRWLKLCQRRKSKLPVDTQHLKRDRKYFRAVIGLKVWPKDVTRHTAASYWIADSPSVADVAKALGNSEAVLRRNYMALVTKAEAEKFWAISPAD